MALGSISDLKRPALVVAPKSAISNFLRASEETKVPLLGVTNVEQLKTGKTPWVKKTDDVITPFRWTLPQDAMLVVDECHRYSGQDTDNGKLLAMAKPQKIPTLLMSATPFDSPLKLRTLGYLLGLHNYSRSSFFSFCRSNGCYNSPFHTGLEFITGQSRLEYLNKIYSKIAKYIVKIGISDIPDFQAGVIYPELFDVDSAKLKRFNTLTEEYRIKAEEAPNQMAQYIHLKQKAEAQKIELLVSLATDLVNEEERSVVIFVTFRLTAEAIYDTLRTTIPTGLITGDITHDRDKTVQDFQCDRTRVLVCTEAGGESINLHHTSSSVYPRHALLTPSSSAIRTLQALGRVARDGSLSAPVQRFILLAGTIEEKVYRNIKNRVTNINTLTDNDIAIELVQ